MQGKAATAEGGVVSDELNRIVGGLLATQEAILSMLREDREATKEHRAEVARSLESYAKRTAALEEMVKRARWTAQGAIFAISAIASAVSAGVTLFYKWWTSL